VELSQRAVFAGATVTGIATAILQQQLTDADPALLRELLDTLDDPAEAV
jgi:hypothetical protein